MPNLRLLSAILVGTAVVAGSGTAGLGGASLAQAASEFTYTVRRDLQAVDRATGTAVPFARESLGGENRRVLGITGRIAIARRSLWVDEGGQLFVHATVPEGLAATPRDLDVLVDGPGGMRVRGSIPFDPAGPRTVARVFVLPELPVGPARTEVHVRGAHTGDWQEILTEAIEVPRKARLRFGYSLDGVDARRPAAVDLVVEARPVVAPGSKPGTTRELLSGRVAAAGWSEPLIDLSKLAGERVQLAFRSKPAAAGDTGAPGVVWGAPTVEVDEKRRAYPVIVVVSLDSLRTSAVGLYAGGGATPFLDAFFGRDGAILTSAVAPAATTLPSHMTLLTGLHPPTHGVVDESRSLAPSVATMAEALRADGWHTVAFTEGGALASEFGFGRGFDIYDEGESRQIGPDQADAITRAEQWVRHYSGRPLFLFVHSYRTRPVHTGAVAGPGVRERQIAAWMEQVRAADKELEGLLGSFRGRIDEKRSLFVVTSGHGDEFFEHGAAGHGTQLYEETVRIPLLFGGREVSRGGRHDPVTGLVDVAPTVLEMAGVRAPNAMQGRSLAPLLRKGKSPDAAPRFSEARRPARLTAAGQLLRWGPPAFSVREGQYKVIWNAGSDESFEAYDLARDPRETRDLVREGRPPEWARRLGASLKGFSGAAGRQAPAVRRVELTPANRARLESLGYAR